MIPDDKVPLSIGGHDLYLRYPIGAMIELQRALGGTTLDDTLKAIDDLQPRPGEGDEEIGSWLLRIDPEKLRLVTWAGLQEACRAKGPQVLFRHPGELDGVIRLGDVSRLLIAINRAVALQFPPISPEPAGEAGEANPPDRPPIRDVAPSTI